MLVYVRLHKFKKILNLKNMYIIQFDLSTHQLPEICSLEGFRFYFKPFLEYLKNIINKQ